MTDRTDNELAECLVANDIGSRDVRGARIFPHNYRYKFGNTLMSTEDFVRDWRVAGMAMEKVRSGADMSRNVLRWVNFMRDVRRIPLDAKSLPRAINEAFCEAMK